MPAGKRKRIKLLDRAKQRAVLLKNKIPAKKTAAFIDRRPFTSFFIALCALFILIVSGNVISNLSKKEFKKPDVVKDAEVYAIGSFPKMTLSGQIEKSGVFKIIAQSSGIVNNINFREGDSISRGQVIMNFSTSYSGGNIPGLQAALTQKQYQNILDTFDTQKEIIEDQRKIADQTAVNNDKLREISSQNLNDTKSLISLNEDILNTLNSQLDVLKLNNAGGVNDAQILATKQLIAQLTGGLLQLKVSSRALSFQVDTSSPPTRLSSLQKDAALKQLDVQLEALKLNKEVSKIQAAIAGVAASLMSPKAPGDGVVDRIYVEIGDSINPGTAVALISGNSQNVDVVVRVPFDIASRVSRTEPSILNFPKGRVKATPFYISLEATDGQLYSIIYSIDPPGLTDGSYIKVDMPIGFADNSAIPFIPIDAVYQTQNEAFLLVAENGKAQARKVTLGTVYGRFVQVLSGLKSSDRVILNRNIIAGDNVKPNF